ncbi:MAG: glycosyltransferase family 39 protein [Candidatus Aquicultorales bacterium]
MKKPYRSAGGRAATKGNLDSRSYLMIALAITGIALALRLYQLGTASIWFDEGWSVRLANMGLGGMLKELAAKDINPPLHFVLLNGWIKLFGDSEIAVRSISALAGAFSVFMLYRLGRLLYDEDTGLIASAFLAVSWFHLYYSQEARGYSLMVLFSILSFYFFAKLFRKRSIGNSAGYVLSSALLLYTHVFGFLVLASQMVYVCALFVGAGNRNNRPLARWSLTMWPLHQLAAVGLFAPWLGTLLKQARVARDGGGSAIPMPTAASLLETLVSFSGSTWALLAYAAAPLILAVLALRRGDPVAFPAKELNKTGFAAAWLLFPMVAALALSLYLQPVYLDKYLIGSMPAFYLLGARAVGSIRESTIKYGIVFVVLVISFLNVAGYYATPRKEEWREVATLVETNAQAGALVLFNPGTTRENAFDYYAKRSDLDKRDLSRGGVLVGAGLNGNLKEAVGERATAWFVMYDELGGARGLQAALGEGWTMAGEGAYGGIGVYVFERQPQ